VTENSWPTNYGVNLGTWLVFDPTGKTTTAGSFTVNTPFSTRVFTDGLSKTLMFSEIKMWQSVYGTISGVTATIPNNTGIICSLGGGASSIAAGLSVTSNTGHTEWGDSKVKQSGFTAAFSPQTVVSCQYAPAGTGPAMFDFDLVSQTEGQSLTVPTYAAVTSRSYHAGVVNASFMDGSVRTISGTIDVSVWQALSSKAGNESVDASNYLNN